MTSLGQFWAKQATGRTSPPRFDLEHRCPQCGFVYKCPDRFIADKCGSSMSDYEFTCSPCCAQADAEDREIWRDANAA